MLFNENSVLGIESVEYMRWNGGKFKVKPRPFSGLAFRVRGDAMIQGGGKNLEVHAGDILYLPQNMGYTAKYGDTEMIAIHFVTAKDDDRIEVYSPGNGEKFSQLFMEMLRIWERKDPGFKVFAMAQLYTILGSLVASEAKQNLPDHFLKALSYLNSHYRENGLCVNRVCTEAGIGATVFRQLFKKHYRETPTEYITRLRLEYARKLISGGETVENAALESGFSDPKYFSRVVKKYFGCTPRAFKTYGK